MCNTDGENHQDSDPPGARHQVLDTGHPIPAGLRTGLLPAHRRGAPAAPARNQAQI